MASWQIKKSMPEINNFDLRHALLKRRHIPFTGGEAVNYGTVT